MGSHGALCAGRHAGDRHAKFKDRMNHAYDVVGDHLQKQLVDLCFAGPATKCFTKHPLHGREGGLGVAPNVVVAQELVPPVVVQVKQLAPRGGDRSPPARIFCARPERYVGEMVDQY